MSNIYIGLPFFDIDSISLETTEGELDNQLIGNYKHIRILTIPHWYMELNKKRKVNCKAVNVPYEGTWQGLTDAFPIGKVIKIRGCYYEVTTLILEVTGKEVLEGKWLDTDDFIATINVKPYGVDTESDNEIVINLGVMG
jgi:hypothetical protein